MKAIPRSASDGILATITTLAIPVALTIVLVQIVTVAGGRSLAQRDATANDPYHRDLTPVADTFVTVSERSTPPPVPTGPPNGDALHLSMGSLEADGLRDTALVRFVVPTSQPDMRLVYADLELDIERVEVQGSNGDRWLSGTMHLTAQRVAAPWDEATLASPDLPERTGPIAGADVPWDCRDDAAGCGTAAIDVRDLVAEDYASPDDLALRAEPAGEPESPLGWAFDAASRESARPPRLRLAYQPVFSSQPPIDLTGTAAYRCDTGGVVLTVRNAGSLDLVVEVRVLAQGAASRRLVVPPPLPAGGSAVVADLGWTMGTTHYVLDPDERLPDHDRTNNVVPILIQECPGPDGPWQAFVPLAMAR